MSSHQILLRPTDILFFRDGRPIEGSLPGHGAAWPLPSVVDAAIHAALHRAYPVDGDGIEGASTKTYGDHVHRAVRKGRIQDHLRIRRFGSLVSAGPFPVSTNGLWYFPRPKDLDHETLEPTLLPVVCQQRWSGSLPVPLRYAVANTRPPSKDSKAKAWLTGAAYGDYLRGSTNPQDGINDSDFFDSEHTIGIGIDPDTQTTGQGSAEGMIYSAQYLRLRDPWRLGQIVSAQNGEAPLLANMLAEHEGKPVILVGGQQRACTAESKVITTPPLPLGLTDGFSSVNGRHLVKWVLLAPAIWPAIQSGPSKRGTENRAHPGGWLPNWIEPERGAVLLRSVGAEERQRRRFLNYANQGYRTEDGADSIDAQLVAAVVPKPIVVTGWSLGESLPVDKDARKPGAKSVHLAVPAGSVYYFETASANDARKLAAALNWHGADAQPTTIKNRRSTLLGEKGFGLGVCGTWIPAWQDTLSPVGRETQPHSNLR